MTYDNAMHALVIIGTSVNAILLLKQVTAIQVLGRLAQELAYEIRQCSRVQTSERVYGEVERRLPSAWRSTQRVSGHQTQATSSV